MKSRAVGLYDCMIVPGGKCASIDFVGSQSAQLAG